MTKIKNDQSLSPDQIKNEVKLSLQETNYKQALQKEKDKFIVKTFSEHTNHNNTQKIKSSHKRTFHSTNSPDEKNAS
jgi:hypothetical protein